MPEDPWRSDWTPTKVEAMFGEVAAKPLYDGVYRDTSEWVHWGPRSILRAMEPRRLGRSRVRRDRPAGGGGGAAARVPVAAADPGRVLDRDFSLGRAERLAELEETMVAILTESVPRADAAGHVQRPARRLLQRQPSATSGPSGFRSEAV
jgi:hypothetical protein